MFAAKDPVSVKFGRDVAGLIHFNVWRIWINSVNAVYRENIRERREVTCKHVIFNWRNLQRDTAYLYSYIYNVRDDQHSEVKLSKNYFVIKELY